MNTEKFTQGEWLIEDQREMYDKVHNYAIVDEEGWYIAHIENCTRMEEQEANAALIAAAPEMYDRLKKTESDLLTIFNPNISQQAKGRLVEIIIENINSVLEKARGKNDY